MPCYHPITAYPSLRLNKNYKREMVFSPSLGQSDKPKLLPCGKCIGCKRERGLQNAIKCQHEVDMYLEDGRASSFITLTYSDDHPSRLWSLNKRDFQLFMKRLRKNHQASPSDPIRYFMCGEYGDKFERPHYHAILFGFQFDDMVEFIKDGQVMYKSEKLDRLWYDEKTGNNFGDATIGDVTFESISYIADHVIKVLTNNQVTGEKVADNHYCGRQPEFCLRSLRPGIGKRWYKKYGAQMYNYDYIEVRPGIKHKPPRYYDKMYEKETSEIRYLPTSTKDIDRGIYNVSIVSGMQVVGERRRKTAKQRAVDIDRLYEKEKYQTKKHELKRRRRKL